MRYTRRFARALDAGEEFVRTGNNREELWAYIGALRAAEREIDGEAERLNQMFEEETGMAQASQAHADDIAALGEDETIARPEQIKVSQSLIREVEAASNSLQKKKVLAFNDIRNSERFQKLCDTHQKIAEEIGAARAECFTPEDHPLIRARKDPKESWLTQLDETNYDVAAAKTPAEKELVRKNLRELDADEADTKRREEAEERAWIERQKRMTDHA